MRNVIYTYISFSYAPAATVVTCHTVTAGFIAVDRLTFSADKTFLYSLFMHLFLAAEAFERVTECVRENERNEMLYYVAESLFTSNTLLIHWFTDTASRSCISSVRHCEALFAIRFAYEKSFAGRTMFVLLTVYWFYYDQLKIPNCTGCWAMLGYAGCEAIK